MPKTQYIRHVLTVHKAEERVKPLLGMEKEIQVQAVDLFRKEAMKNHNIKCLNNSDDNFVRERASQKEEVPVMCTGCNGFYDKGYRARHQLKCPSNGKNLMLPMVALEKQVSNFENYSEGFKSLLNTLHLDAVAEVVKTDKIILMIGHRFFNSLKRKKDKKVECLKYVRSKMRLTARVYMAFKVQYDDQTEFIPSDLENNSADMFRRETITVLGEAVNKLCDKPEDTEALHEESSVTGQKSSLKISIFNLFKTNAQYLMGYFLIHNEDKKKDRVVDFLQVLKLLENEIFGDAFYDINFKKNVTSRKSKNLPNDDDVQMLLSECEEVMKSADVLDISSANFVPVRAATATYLIIFNARRGGEPPRLVIRQWEEAVNGEWMDEVPSGEDPELLVTYQTGKGINHLVPVMFPPIVHKAMQYLVNPEVRENANVSSANKYIFPSVGNSQNHASGWHSINDMLIRISKQGCINATRNRHRVASLLSKLQLTEKEKQLIFKHFGHSGKVNEDVYQSAAGSSQIESTGQKLLQVT